MVTQRRNIALENFIFMVATVNHWIIQGYAHAQYTLGLIYRNGSGINVNHYESQKWLKLAAKQHYKNAERLLAGLPAH